jgi:hypothetical protein
MDEAQLAQLKTGLSYNPQAGEFRRLTRRGKWAADSVAGTVNSHGYVIINWDRKLYPAHRLAWMFVHGLIADGMQVDHRDGCRTNNSITNLRLATNAQNAQNTFKARRNNKAGLLGVVPNRKRWAAQITFDGRTRHIGTFDTPELAHAAYLREKALTHPFHAKG